MLLPWNAAALPEIVAGAVQESKRTAHWVTVGRPRSSRPETGQRRRSTQRWNSSSQSEA